MSVLGFLRKKRKRGQEPTTVLKSQFPGLIAKARFLILLNKLRKELRKPDMKIASVLSVARHILTFAGGYLVSKGLLDEETLNQLVGGIITVGGIIWGILEKKGR